MSSPFPTPEFANPLASGAPLAGLNAAAALVDRRSHAVADYWRGAAAAHEPSELLGLQLGYWTQMLDDYAQALTESFAPITVEAPAEVFLPAVIEPKPAKPRAEAA
jgi:hypothetical protein